MAELVAREVARRHRQTTKQRQQQRRRQRATNPAPEARALLLHLLRLTLKALRRLPELHRQMLASPPRRTGRNAARR